MNQSPDDAVSPVPEEQSVDSNEGAAPRFRVAVFAVPDERETLLPVLAQIPELTPIDARVRLHELPGILPERFDQESADQMVRDFVSAGVNAATFSDADVPRLEHRRTVHHVRCVSAGLEFVGTGGTTEFVLPWTEVSLASIGVVPVDQSHHEIASPTAVIHAAPGVHGVETESRTAHGPEMWLAREGPFEAWRIDHLAMNYEYLGDRMSTSAAANFQLFAQDLAEQAQGTYFTPSARAFLHTQRAEEYRFETREAHAKSVKLHILLRRTMRVDS